MPNPEIIIPRGQTLNAMRKIVTSRGRPLPFALGSRGASFLQLETDVLDIAFVGIPNMTPTNLASLGFPPARGLPPIIGEPFGLIGVTAGSRADRKEFYVYSESRDAQEIGFYASQEIIQGWRSNGQRTLIPATLTGFTRVTDSQDRRVRTLLAEAQNNLSSLQQPSQTRQTAGVVRGV